jgi:hypothetical protein
MTKTTRSMPGAPVSRTVARITPSVRTVVPELSQDREKMIADAAYFLAQRRHFAPGHELEDWLQAEREIDEQFGA